MVSLYTKLFVGIGVLLYFHIAQDYLLLSDNFGMLTRDFMDVIKYDQQ